MSRVLSTGFGILAAALVAMWAIEIVDTVALDSELQTNGIHPREFAELDGVLWAPFLHSTFAHLISNSIPLLVLGSLVALRGLRYWTWMTVSIVIIGGGLTWLLGGSGNHIGASGVVFGYFGALMGAAVFERRIAALATALVALFLYSSILVGLIPQIGISWEGHLFGLVAGFGVARSLRTPRQPEPEIDKDDPQYPWELDEPWLEN